MKTFEQVEELADLNGLEVRLGDAPGSSRVVCEDHNTFWTFLQGTDEDIEPFYNKVKKHLTETHEECLEPEEL